MCQDPFGNLTTYADAQPTPRTTSYSYDLRDRQTQVNEPTGRGVISSIDRTNATATPTPFAIFSYTLDGNGQVTSASDPTQPVTTQHSYSRNTLDQLTSDQAAPGSSPPRHHGVWLR